MEGNSKQFNHKWGAVIRDDNIEKLENILGGRLLEQGAYYVEYGNPWEYVLEHTQCLCNAVYFDKTQSRVAANVPNNTQGIYTPDSRAQTVWMAIWSFPH